MWEGVRGWGRKDEEGGGGRKGRGGVVEYIVTDFWELNFQNIVTHINTWPEESPPVFTVRSRCPELLEPLA